jgi:hypothetical protein
MGAFPHHLMASHNGKLLYVGEYGTNKVGVVDTTTDALAAEWEASANPLAKTHAVWITASGKELYATNEGSTQAAIGTLSKLDPATGARLWEVPIGARPSEVLVTPNGKTAYVTVRNENVLKVLDVSGDAPAGPTGEVVVGGMPDTMQITGDGKTLVVGLRSVPQMALVDTDTLAVRHVTFQGFGISGHQWLSPERPLHVHRARERGHHAAGRDRGGGQRVGRGARNVEVSGRAVPARRLLRAAGAAVAQPPGRAATPSPVRRRCRSASRRGRAPLPPRRRGRAAARS